MIFSLLFRLRYLGYSGQPSSLPSFLFDGNLTLLSPSHDVKVETKTMPRTNCGDRDSQHLQPLRFSRRTTMDTSFLFGIPNVHSQPRLTSSDFPLVPPLPAGADQVLKFASVRNPPPQSLPATARNRLNSLPQIQESMPSNGRGIKAEQEP
ncbi:uncharacterized protein BJX67DRAFT_93332 [Aspergillus lucknowensis]|uniref:Uncharacterized protein n=1 Tax=Aspergillus lucknowensis TaxID=176173 RepID=A0ABR4M5S0_9EURO